MTRPLSEARAADRLVMTIQLAAAVLAAGGTIASDLLWKQSHRRAVMLHIYSPAGPTISVEFNGESWQVDTHVATWNLPFEMSKAGVRFRDNGSGWSQPHHKRTIVTIGFEPLVDKIVADLVTFGPGGEGLIHPPTARAS